MRIGVVSDTHNNLANVGRIVDLFNAADVTRVVHTGDVTQAKTLDRLSHLTMPLWGVWGNNDQERESLEAAVTRHGFTFCEPPLHLAWHDRTIVVVHDPLELIGLDVARNDVVLHGHTHRQTITREDGLLTFNPGECAGMMRGYNTVGVLDLDNLSTEILSF